jgi:predicted nucleic acid-binding protein
MNLYFDNDAVNFQFVQQKDKVREIAKNLIAKYWKDGLRTLDSIQLASALSVKYGIDRFFTSDKLLSDVAIHEGLEVKID